MRTLPPLPPFSPGKALIEAIEQFKLGRILLGGMYVKMNGRWHSCNVTLVFDDGSRVLCRDDSPSTSFHESFMGVQALEEFK